MKYINLLLVFIGFPLFLIAQDQAAYNIRIDLQDYSYDTLYLAHYYGDKHLMSDTAVKENSMFTFAGDQPLRPGAYLVVMKPDNKFFHLSIPQDDQRFSIKASAESPETSISVVGSIDNQIYYDHLDFIAAKRAEVNELQTTPGSEERIDKINAEVTEAQTKLIEDNPGTVSAFLINASLPLDLPEFEGSEKEINKQRYNWYKKHFFDNFNPADPLAIRTPVIHQKINEYLKNLTAAHPDSIIAAQNFLLNKMEPSEEAFRFYLVHFLNEAANNKRVGSENVYVNLVDNYYLAGKAPWASEEQVNSLKQSADEMRSSMIGKRALDFTVQTADSTDISLYQINSPWTILIFWAADCSHCKETMPDLQSFYQEYAGKGVEIFAVCTKINEKEKECWKFLQENGLTDWINASDKRKGRSYIHSKYNIKKTPSLFVLDDDKTIVMKGIGIENLPQVMDALIAEKAADN